MKPQETWGLSWSGASARPSLRRRLTLAAGVGLSLAVALLVWSCEGSPTSTTGGGGGGGVPPGWTPVQIGQPLPGTIAGTDTLCTDQSDYYSPGVPCQKFAFLLPGRAGVLTVQLAWDDPANQLELQILGANPASECCTSPLTHQVTVAAQSPYSFAYVDLIGPKDPSGRVASTLSQKFTLTTSFNPQ